MLPLEDDNRAALELLAQAIRAHRAAYPPARPDCHLQLDEVAEGSRFSERDLIHLLHPFTDRGEDPEVLVFFRVSTKHDHWYAGVEDWPRLERRLAAEPFTAPKRPRPSPLAG